MLPWQGAPAAAGWDQRAAMANGFGSKIALARASSSPVISGLLHAPSYACHKFHEKYIW